MEPPLSKSTIRTRLLERDFSDRMHESDIALFASRKKKASVLVPLILCENGDLEVLLTKRAAHLRADAGDVAFPGGKRDDEDADDTATALRESWEEIGLHPSDVEVVSQLPPMTSRHGYFITPVTGLIPETFEPDINPNEVEDVFRVPLIDFLLCDNHKSQRTSSKGRFAWLHYFEHIINGKGFITWGLTAYLCITAACTIYQRAPDFEMEPGFDHENLAQGFIDLMAREKKEEALSADGSKL
ncbi:nudix hydrolase 11-like [Lytechinus variegatus]|uniref:nudix hydrolase 11-like n=1 Tax=Lytechinus variegatus TaxID=7654 RepID=UPI001BB2AB28|nr:nudix hydrolase 11-like [Lytechinus variegatus]